MLPILLDLKFVKIYTFGVFLVLAFFWASYLLWKVIRLTVYKEEDVFDGVFWSLAGSLFLGRLVYVILNFNQFGADLLKFILINGYPGLSLYGALGGGFLTLLVFSYFKKIKFNEMGDYFISPLFLGLAFGKLGSFFSGSEIGPEGKTFLSIPLYESILFFLGAYLSYRLLFQIRKEKHPKGFNLYFFGWYFALVYFIFDKLKEYHLYFKGYSFNKFISLVLLLTFSFYFLYYFRSLLLKRLVKIKNSIFPHGQKKTHQKNYFSAKTKIRRGKDEITKAD